MDDIEHWKKRMLTLPDADFFEIMRNYLGELKTPFNKHSLIEELIVFLRRPSTRERILDRIDSLDAEILSAIALLGEPQPERIHAFFAADRGYIDLHNHLINLEERLLVYRDGAPKSPRVRINPLLQPALTGIAIHPEILFPSRPASGSEPSPPWLRDQLVLAFISYLAHHESLLKADGRFKKRAEDELLRLFPSLVVKTERGPRLDLLAQALARLRILQPADGAFEIDLARLRALGSLDEASRSLILSSASLDRAPIEGPMNPGEEEALQARIEQRAQLLCDLLASLDAKRCYPLLSIERILAAVCGEAKEGRQELDGSELARLLSGLIELEMLTPSGKSGYRKNALPCEPARTRGPKEEGGLVVQPNFVLTVMPQATFAEGIEIALAAEIATFDIYPQYELTKRSFLRGLDRALSGVDFQALVESASGRELPQNVRFSLESWEAEYRGIGLYAGIVLTADEKRRHLIDHSEIMKPWIRKTLAPGVYLLDPRESEEWQRALDRAGVGPLPQIQIAGRPSIRKGSGRGFGAIGVARPLSAATDIPGRPAPSNDGKRREAINRELVRTLDGLKLTDELKGELSARIKKKLILFPDQIAQATSRPEKSEAKGLDYLGKVRLIEQAMKTGSELLEIIERSPAGSTRRVLLRPSELRKAGDDLILLGSEIPREDPIQIKVRKIVLVRKLKSSLYAP